MTYPNVAFLSARKSGYDYYTNNEQTQLLRSELIKLGLAFEGVRVNGELHFMVTTNNLQLIKKLAKDFKCGKFYISDCYRTLFEVSLIGNKYSPTNLGTLKRLPQSTKSSSTNTAGAFCLLVEENGASYSYGVQQSVEEVPQLDLEKDTLPEKNA